MTIRVTSLDEATHRAKLNERVQVAEDRLEKPFSPDERKPNEALDRATQKVGEISYEVSERERWMDDHPHAPAQLAGLGAKLREVEHVNDQELWTVEGGAEPPTGPGSGRPLPLGPRRQPQHRQRPRPRLRDVRACLGPRRPRSGCRL